MGAKGWLLLGCTLLGCAAHADGSGAPAPKPAAAPAAAATPGSLESVVVWSGADAQEAQAWLERWKAAEMGFYELFEGGAGAGAVEQKEGQHWVVAGTCSGAQADAFLALVKSIFPAAQKGPAAPGAVERCPHSVYNFQVRSRREQELEGWRFLLNVYFAPAQLPGVAPDVGTTVVIGALFDPKGVRKKALTKRYESQPDSPGVGRRICKVALSEKPGEYTVLGTCDAKPQECLAMVTHSVERTVFKPKPKDLGAESKVLEEKRSKGCESD